ncbi:hypothetical protein [Sedimenticola hydrogenitrophicus]|uniref:hypothetical protein n=1 Tax=Sedimenticola hydrogenitrophicus TaxID=2967975 RepID=UPI0023AE8760|nr:hypothetical protein [Sedimenticola hydrogenitrophicus]
MNIIFVHGEKGGVGKSMSAMALIEHCRGLGLNPFLIEGDTGIPDVASRYRGVIDGVQIPLSRPDLSEEAIGELLELLESNLDDLAGRPVVVNLPAGAASTVDRSAAMIRAVCDAAGWEVVTLYLLGAGIESSTSAIESLSAGLAGVSDRKIALRNLAFGDPNRWPWTRDGHQEAWISAGGQALDFAELTGRTVEKIRGSGPLGPLISGEEPGLFLVDRSILHRWLSAFEPIIEAAGLVGRGGDDE